MWLWSDAYFSSKHYDILYILYNFAYCYVLGENFQESLETGHGNDSYIDSGELVLGSL